MSVNSTSQGIGFFYDTNWTFYQMRDVELPLKPRYKFVEVLDNPGFSVFGTIDDIDDDDLEYTLDREFRLEYYREINGKLFGYYYEVSPITQEGSFSPDENG